MVIWLPDSITILQYPDGGMSRYFICFPYAAIAVLTAARLISK